MPDHVVCHSGSFSLYSTSRSQDYEALSTDRFADRARRTSRERNEIEIANEEMAVNCVYRQSIMSS